MVFFFFLLSVFASLLFVLYVISVVCFCFCFHVIAGIDAPFCNWICFERNSEVILMYKFNDCALSLYVFRVNFHYITI